MRMIALAVLILMLLVPGPLVAQVAPGQAEITGYDGLFRAAATGDVATIERLAAEGAKLNVRDGRRRTPMMVAAHLHQYDAARALIGAGANVNAFGADRYDLLTIAAAHLGHDEVVRTLIDGGASLNHITNLDWAALIDAIVLGDGGPRHVTTFRALVDAGADVNIPDGRGVSPLTLARQRGYADMVEILAAAGALP